MFNLMFRSFVAASTLALASPAFAADRDGDGVPDGEDNCPDTYNPPVPGGFQRDHDKDGVGDECDPLPYGRIDERLDAFAEWFLDIPPCDPLLELELQKVLDGRGEHLLPLFPEAEPHGGFDAPGGALGPWKFIEVDQDLQLEVAKAFDGRDVVTRADVEAFVGDDARDAFDAYAAFGG